MFTFLSSLVATLDINSSLGDEDLTILVTEEENGKRELMPGTLLPRKCERQREWKLIYRAPVLCHKLCGHFVLILRIVALLK